LTHVAWDDGGVATKPSYSRWLALDGAANARAVVPGVLLRSDNLQGLSPRDVRVLVDGEGLEVVLDLRTEVEIELEGPGPMAAEPRVRIEHRSLYLESGGNTDLDPETVNPWLAADAGELQNEDLAVRVYMSYLNRRPDSIVASIRTIARTDGAVLLHCAAGKDRTGVVVALALDAVGADRDLIVADYVATQDRIEAIMQRLVSSPTYRAGLEGHDPQSHAPVPATMWRVLELIDERFGGASEWLSEHGLSQLDHQRLRRRLDPDRLVSPR
jgi:protein-tyrosine phosphatase